VRVSVLIPVYNEEAVIAETLRAVLRESPYEVIVSDGGSRDSTVARAAPLARIVSGAKGRGMQLNLAARHASGDILLFLHADANLAPGGLARAVEAIEQGAVGGNFDVEFEGGDWVAAAFGWINRVRCRFGVFYGDSGIFCRRDLFERLGGYQEWAILEDYEFARRLWKSGRVALLDCRIRVSSRRWRKGGTWAAMWSWFWIQGLYLAGVHPDRLSRIYRDVR
jgi:rSAM/selenodomain-associated transferase 2